MTFSINPAAPTLPADYKLISNLDVAPILVDATLICESVEDNDIERWRLTAAGQFVRETGATGGRFYVVPANEAEHMLVDFAEDSVVDELRSVGALPAKAPHP